jgi:hypothetical protein
MTDRQHISDELLREGQRSFEEQQEAQAKTTKQEVKEGFTSFGASEEIDDYIYFKMRWMSSFKDYDGHAMPRFGLMSLMVHQTQVIPYDNPAMNRISKTGFTDGIRVFMHADFVAKGKAEEEESNGTQQFLVPFAMHEFTHKLRRHTTRHSHWNPYLANRAQDLSINSSLIVAFPEMKWVPLLTETGIGFGPGEAEKFMGLSEEKIYMDLLREAPKLLKQPKPPGGGGGSGQQGQGGGSSGPSQPGQGQSGQSQSGDDDDADDQNSQSGPGGNQPNPSSKGGQRKGEPSDKFGGMGDFHTITPEELIKILEDAGMDESIKRLGLPSSSDKKAIDEQKARADMGQVEAVHRALDQMREAERRNCKYPGAGMVEGMVEMYNTQAKPQMTWRLAYRDAFFQNGYKEVYKEDEPDEIYFFPTVTRLLGNPLYTGIHVPEKPASAVLVIMDASSSVDTEQFKEHIAEIYGLKGAAQGESATEVLIIMGASDLVDGIQILDEDNWEAQIKGKGIGRTCYGGTNLHVLVNKGLERPEIAGLHIQSVIMFTDSYDSAPKLSKMNFDKKRPPNIVYAVSSSTGMGDVEKFAKEVGNEGRVVRIDEGVVVDLTDAYLDTMSASPSETESRARRRRSP